MSRESFEAAMIANMVPIDRFRRSLAVPDDYHDIHMQMNWETWQAAESVTARQCAIIASGWVDGRSIVVDIKIAYPEAFKPTA